jgi:hypothetical protein
MRKLRTCLAELWYRRPVLTTHARIHNKVDEANDAEPHGEVYFAGYLAGFESGVAAKKAARLTSTGRTLQAV